MSIAVRTICSVMFLIGMSALCAGDVGGEPNTATARVEVKTDVVVEPNTAAAGAAAEVKTTTEEKAAEAEQMETLKEVADKEKRQAIEEARMLSAERRRAKLLAEVEKLTLPEDTSPRLAVKEIRISGNSLVSVEQIIQSMPLVYNASKLPLSKAKPENLYDLRVVEQVLTLPGEAREVSTRSIQGFIQYILSVYQERHLGGIYIYVPKGAIREGTKLEGDILPIEIIEAPVSSVNITAYDVKQNQRENPILRRELIEEWSPVKSGKVVNRKELDDFINLLNLDPDRYVSATISKGTEPNSLAVGYDVYETSPWHYYIQIDNSGTSDRQWKPRLGLINTNLTGRDDRLTLMTQIAPEHGIEDNYAVYGSYEVPLWTPRLRFTAFGGKSKFDTAVPGISFLGNGSFYGGMLRFNVFQVNTWFIDVLTSLSKEESHITPSLFPSEFKYDLEWLLWSVGGEIHHRDDMSQTSIAFNRYASADESSASEFEKARPGAKPGFAIYMTSIMHSQFLDTYKVHRINGSFRLINANQRLVPAKMTTFGGLYTVRGYKEDRIVADEGLLYSVQYEYDLVKRSEREAKSAVTEDVNAPAEVKSDKSWLKRLAPVCFIDGGVARIKDRRAGDQGTENLTSVGLGLIGEVGENFEAATYLGWPLRDAGPTESGKPRLNVSFIARW